MKIRKIIVFFVLSLCLVSVNVKTSMAMGNNVPDIIIEYVTNLYNHNSNYDVIDENGNSVKNEFMKENNYYYENKEYEELYSNIGNEKLILVSFGETNTTTRASTTKNLTKTYVHTVRFTSEKSTTFSVECYATIRVNEGTGVITSFSGPSVSLKNPSGGAVSEKLYDVSTSYKWGSSTHRTIDFTYNYGYERVEPGSYGTATTYRSPYYTKVIHGE